MNDRPIERPDVQYVDDETFRAAMAHEVARWRTLLDALADS